MEQPSEQPTNPNGGLIQCPNCGKPMGRRQGFGKFSYLNRQGGQQNKIDIESDSLKMRCSSCGVGGNIFVHIREGIGMREEFTTSLKKDDGVDKQMLTEHAG